MAAFPRRELVVRIGRGRLHVCTDEIGISFRWVPPAQRGVRVIDGEFVATHAGAVLPRAEVIPSGGVKGRMFTEKACLDCENEWGMHHRCPAQGGRYVCC